MPPHISPSFFAPGIAGVPGLDGADALGVGRGSDALTVGDGGGRFTVDASVGLGATAGSFVHPAKRESEAARRQAVRRWVTALR
jgi:hypothetical protein